MTPAAGVSAAHALLTTWDLTPAVLAAAFVSLLLFAHAFTRLRRRGRTDHAGWDRAALFVAGVAVATIPLISPLDAVADQSLISAHMLEHVLLGDLAPALLLLALRGPLLFFFVPAAVLKTAGRSAPLRAVLHRLFLPAVSLVVWAIALASWHVPAAYDFALHHPAVHDLEHASFLLAGLLVWSQLIDPARRRALSLSGRLAFAGTLFLLGQVLANILLLWPHALYPAYASVPDRLFGLTALADQQAAGLVMMAEQLLTLGTCAILLLRPCTHAHGEPGRPVTTLVSQLR